MKFGLNVLLIIAAIIFLTIIALRIMKLIKKVGKYGTKEFEVISSVYKDWESAFSNPGKITVETLHAGDVPGTIHGIINIKNEKASGLSDAELKAPLLAHLVHHEKFGNFLIDTGFDSSFAEKTWGNFEGILKKGAFKYSVEKGYGIEEQLKTKNIKLCGVFCTHFHEHQAGAPALPEDIPFIFGKGEKDIDAFPIVYGRFLKSKSDLREVYFNKAGEMPITGKTVDIFGDGSLWAISTPGHTKGHISYLINGIREKVLIMGDVCMCRNGFELEVESGGKFAENLEDNRKSFQKLRKLIDTYPGIRPIFGHESDEFPITYFS